MALICASHLLVAWLESQAFRKNFVERRCGQFTCGERLRVRGKQDTVQQLQLVWKDAGAESYWKGFLA